jgi:hypothetical protein
MLIITARAGQLGEIGIARGHSVATVTIAEVRNILKVTALVRTRPTVVLFRTCSATLLLQRYLDSVGIMWGGGFLFLHTLLYSSVLVSTSFLS